MVVVGLQLYIKYLSNYVKRTCDRSIIVSLDFHLLQMRGIILSLKISNTYHCGWETEIELIHHQPPQEILVRILVSWLCHWQVDNHISVLNQASSLARVIPTEPTQKGKDHQFYSSCSLIKLLSLLHCQRNYI